MPAIIAGIALLFTFFREIRDLFRQPECRALLVWVGILLAIGSAFYRTIEGWSWLDSLYFCTVTLATVGYGDLTPTTDLGKAFAIIYIFLGLGLIASFASMLAKDRLRIAESRQSDNKAEGE
jgi:voltage-gated potassium channel